MKFEKKSSQVNQSDKNNADGSISPEKKRKSLINKETNSESKSKTKKDQKQKTSIAITEELDFSKRDMELQNFLTGNLNKILYNRNKTKRVTMLEKNDVQILSIKDIKNVRKKLNKMSNEESFVISENSRLNPNLSFNNMKNSKKISMNLFHNRSDKSISHENKMNSFNKKSKINLLLRSEFENFPRINNFISYSEIRKGDDNENINNLKEKNQQLKDGDVKSSKFSSNNKDIKNPSDRVSNKNDIEKGTQSYKVLDEANKQEIAPDINANENDDLGRLEIFSSQQKTNSNKENFLDFGLNEKKEELNAEPTNNFIRPEESKNIFKSPKSQKVNRKFSQSLHPSKKFSENNALYKKNFSIFPSLTTYEKTSQSSNRPRPLSHSKSLVNKNQILDINNKPTISLNYKSSTRALNNPNNINVNFENNAINNQRVNPSFKNITDFMQFNKNHQIKSTKTILNSGNLSKIMHQQTEDAVNGQDFNSEFSEISDTDKERHRKLTHRNKVIDSHSDNDDIVIQDEQYPAEGFVFDLNSTFIGYWDLLITLITLYTLTYSPYKMAFPEVTNTIIEIIECFMDLIFIIDIAFQFFIPFYNYEEELIKSKYLIAINYLTGWFLIDLVASVPGSIITYFMVGINPQEDVSSLDKVNSTSFENINKLTRLAKFYRVLKITKLSKVLKMSGDGTKKKRSNKLIVNEDIGISSSVKRILNFLFVFVFASHMITCIWIFIGTLDYPNWLKKARLSDSSNFAIYISSLYFHWTTIFTIGYGDILSANTTERFYNIFLMFVGVLIYSFAVSALGTILSQDDKSAERFLKNIDLLYEMRVRYNIPLHFYEKVEKFLRYDFKNNKMEKFSFINDLPMRIKNELLLNMYRDVIKNFKFFKEKSIDFSTRVVFMMKPLRLSKNEYLISEGEFVEEIVFVRSGYLTVNLGMKFNELKVMEIRPNEHFGDILVLFNLPSPIGVKVASKFADLIIIRKEDITELSNLFPECIQKIFWISSYNYYAMMSLIDRKKQKFKIEEEKTLKKQMLYDNYLSLIEQKKKINPIFLTDANKNYSNPKGLFSKNLISTDNNHSQIKEYQNDLSLPYNEISVKNKLGEFNPNRSNHKDKFGKGLEDSFKLVSNFKKNHDNSNLQFQGNKADTLSGFFKHKLQEKVKSDTNKNKSSNTLENYKQLANYESKNPLYKLNKISESKKNINKIIPNNNLILSSNYGNLEYSNFFNNKNEVKESLSLVKSNENNEKMKEIGELQSSVKSPQSMYSAIQSINWHCKSNSPMKQLTSQLLNVDSSYNSLNYKKIINLNNNIVIKDNEKNKESSVDPIKTQDEKNKHSIQYNTNNNNLGNKSDSDSFSRNKSVENSIHFKKENSEKEDNNDLDFSYNKFNLNDQSSIIGINNCNSNYSRKNSEILILKDDFYDKTNTVEKLNININNVVSNSNHNAYKANDNCIFSYSNNKKGNEIQNIQKINIVSSYNKNNNNKINDGNKSNNNNNNNNLNLEHETLNNLNKINFANIINNIPQKIFNTNDSCGSKSENSNNNSHNNYNLNNNNNLNLITLTTENSKILINTKQKSEAEVNNNNINNTQNTNLIINNSLNLLENPNKSNEETLNEKNKGDDKKNSIKNSKKLVSPSANNFIYIDNLNINNNCNHIYESGGKKCGDGYCISNDSESRKNFSKNEKKNKPINNIFALKSKQKFREDETNEKEIKDGNKNNCKNSEIYNFKMNPNINDNVENEKNLRVEIDNESNSCVVNKEKESLGFNEKAEDSIVKRKKFSINLEKCKKDSSAEKSSADGNRKLSLKENKMKILNKLTKRVSSGKKITKEKESNKKLSGELVVEIDNDSYFKSKKNKLNYKKDSSNSSSDGQLVNKISTKVKSKSISSPGNNPNFKIGNDKREVLMENKNLAILKNILNYREKEFKLKQKLSLKVDSIDDQNKLGRTNTINYLSESKAKENRTKRMKGSFSKKANKITKFRENSQKLNELNEIKEEDFFNNLDSDKKIIKTDLIMSDKLKKIDSDDYDYNEDLKQKDLKTDRQIKSNMKNYKEMDTLNEYDIKRKKSNSFNLSKTTNNLKNKKSSDQLILEAEKSLEDFLIESEDSSNEIKEDESDIIIKTKNKATYLSNFNSENSELKRFVTLGIQQEYKLEAEKINKIMIKILENNNKQDFFELDKNKKFLKFKEYFVFNTNMINKVKKTQKEERKMDKIKIPFVQL